MKSDLALVKFGEKELAYIHTRSSSNRTAKHRNCQVLAVRTASACFSRANPADISVEVKINDFRLKWGTCVSQMNFGQKIEGEPSTFFYLPDHQRKNGATLATTVKVGKRY